MRRGLAAVGLMVLVAACQTPPTSPGATRPRPARDPAAAAQAALARRGWAVAAPLFREAIAGAPTRLTLHYGLAICASHLDEVGEAAREFHWVLEHAAPGAEEAKVARAWLAEQNADPSLAAVPPTADDPTVDKGSVSGSITWGEPGQRRVRERQVVLLQGIRATPTAGLLYRTRTDERGQYELKHIVPGPYKMTDAIAGEATWRLKVTVEPARTSVLDLSPDNSLRVRDDFPEASQGETAPSRPDGPPRT